ncbi:MAG: hypothetical protein NTY19_45650 [Planctomycetota bacterium]|nr:hypothetical protein [Planctomycetota bacterium]
MRIETRQLVTVMAFLGCIGCAVAVLVAAQPQQPKANPVGSAQSAVAQAKKGLDAARAAVNSASAHLTTVTKQAHDLRKKLEEEYETAPEMVAARKQLEQDKATLDQTKTPLMEKLHQQAEYQAAITTRDDAKKKLKSKEYSLAILDIKKRESEVIESNPQAKTALAAHTESETKLHELVEKHRGTLLQDSRVVAVRGEIDKAKEAVAQAKAKLAAEQKKVGEAEHKLAQEQQKNQPKQPTKGKRK